MKSLLFTSLLLALSFNTFADCSIRDSSSIWDLNQNQISQIDQALREKGYDYVDSHVQAAFMLSADVFGGPRVEGNRSREIKMYLSAGNKVVAQVVGYHKSRLVLSYGKLLTKAYIDGIKKLPDCVEN